MRRPDGFTMRSLHFDGSELTPEEIEFALAMSAYQKRFQRRYPTWREVLLVAHQLGYRKVAPPALAEEAAAGRGEGRTAQQAPEAVDAPVTPTD
jgi:hypothetical protein